MMEHKTKSSAKNFRTLGQICVDKELILSHTNPHSPREFPSRPFSCPLTVAVPQKSGHSASTLRWRCIIRHVPLVPGTLQSGAACPSNPAAECAEMGPHAARSAWQSSLLAGPYSGAPWAPWPLSLSAGASFSRYSQPCFPLGSFHGRTAAGLSSLYI